MDCYIRRKKNEIFSFRRKKIKKYASKCLLFSLGLGIINKLSLREQAAATVAQSVEQLIRNQQVAGSSPASSSKKNLESNMFSRFFFYKLSAVYYKPRSFYFLFFCRIFGDTQNRFAVDLQRTGFTKFDSDLLTGQYRNIFFISDVFALENRREDHKRF